MKTDLRQLHDEWASALDMPEGLERIVNALPYLLAVVEAAWVETDAHSARCRCIVELRRALDALNDHLRGEK
jgi:hypothetical protein